MAALTAMTGLIIRHAGTACRNAAPRELIGYSSIRVKGRHGVRCPNNVGARRQASVLCAASDSGNFPRTGNSTSDEEWRSRLTPLQYSVLREKATEEPHSGEYNRTSDEGVYKCAGCGQSLYTSDTKFTSACGWPAFYEELAGAVERQEDRSLGLTRTEITCSNCGGHLGHVFEGEGFPTPTDQRHCVNSLALVLDRRELHDSERRVNDVLESLRWSGE